MAKSNILKELVNNEVSTEIALKRLMLLANDLGYEELKLWAKKELNGYDTKDEIPDYRKMQSINLIYSGISGNYQITNNPLPMGYLNSDTLKEIRGISIKEPIKTIQDKANSDKEQLHIDRTYLAGQVYKNTQDGFWGVQCTKISQIFQASQFEEIVSKINMKVLEVFLELDKKFGNLDALDIDTSNTKIIKNVEHTINFILNDNSVNISDKSKIKDSNLTTGNNVDNKKTNLKTKNTNIGEGTNSVVTETVIDTDVNTTIKKEEKKKSWFKKLFRRNK